MRTWYEIDFKWCFYWKTSDLVLAKIYDCFEIRSCINHLVLINFKLISDIRWYNITANIKVVNVTKHTLNCLKTSNNVRYLEYGDLEQSAKTMDGDLLSNSTAVCCWRKVTCAFKLDMVRVPLSFTRQRFCKSWYWPWYSDTPILLHKYPCHTILIAIY